MIVKVKNIPVRYNDKTYVQDEEIEISKEEYEGLENYLEIVKEDKKKETKDK